VVGHGRSPSFKFAVASSALEVIRCDVWAASIYSAPLRLSTKKAIDQRSGYLRVLYNFHDLDALVAEVIAEHLAL
jgi:hypothetical protein